MERATFEHVTYVHATPDGVWRALLEPDFTRRYWFHEFESDWEVGSEWRQRGLGEAGTVAVQGEVLEIDHPHRLVLSWAQPEHAGDPENTSRVTFEVSEQTEWPHGPWSGLRLAHSELQPDSEMHQSISFGWPAVLAGLKSLVEAPEIFEG